MNDLTWPEVVLAGMTMIFVLIIFYGFYLLIRDI